MRSRRAAAIVILFSVAAISAGAAEPEPASLVRVWEGSETIPTYEEGPPDKSAPFDLFTSSRFNYPYTLRENLTDRRSPRVWRTLNLENEYLKVSVLPDLGGRLWRCIDKVNGASLFYANPSLKFAQVAYRGAWATFGIEWNFPVSHNWVTSSPVDFATVKHPDGGASIVVGNIDLVYGMQWRVELTLRPGRSVLEQATTLYNRSDLRHRFYWWTNAAVEAWDDSRLVYPMAFTASHGFTEVDTWPVNTAGVDLSRPGNHLAGPVSLFSHATREPFMGVYHPRTRAGVAHWADPAELPAKKVWSWGGDADGRDWRKALSDNDSAEVEIQAGLFRNQETYGFLDPQETVRFHEWWLPVRETSGFVRVTPDAVLNVERAHEKGGGEALSIGLTVTRAVTRGRLQIKDGARVVVDEALSLSPAGVLRKRYPGLASAGRYTVEAKDDAGRSLVVHTEGVYDQDPPAEVAVGAKRTLRVPAPEARIEDDWVALGDAQEREGKLLKAFDTYEAALVRYPTSFRLNKAAGRLAVSLKRYDEAIRRLARAEVAVTNDAEIQYALGIAWNGRREGSRARVHFERALRAERTRVPALLQIARLLATGGDLEGALERIRTALRLAPRNVRAGTFEVILLRRLGRREEAKARLAYWRGEDPTLSALRHESVKLGDPDAALFAHLAGDPQRVIEVAIDYMDLGLWDDALELLARDYPTGEGVVAEPGLPPPQRHPEVVYYRGYCREESGLSGRGDFDLASKVPTTYVFPQRAWTLPVLQRAIAANPKDATAHFLLGSLYLSGGIADRAVAEWEEARRLKPEIPGLHRNLGLTLLHALGRTEAAREVFAEGIRADPDNAEVYQGLDQALGLLGRPADERVRALEAYPHQDHLPGALVFKEALALVEAGRASEAQALFAGRFFAREEFGTNVRQVFVEVEVQEARALARNGDCAGARLVVDGLGREVPGLAFTQAGLDPFAEGARTQYLVGEILAACGDAAAARTRWEKAAAATDAYPQAQVAFALKAAERLGRPEAVKPRVEAALEAWANRLVVGTNFPGANAAGQGLFLHALGRESDAAAKLREALLLPDKVMSHYLSREALAEMDGPEPK